MEDISVSPFQWKQINLKKNAIHLLTIVFQRCDSLEKYNVLPHVCFHKESMQCDFIRNPEDRRETFGAG